MTVYAHDQQPSVRERSMFREVLAVLLLLFGALGAGIGWLVGVALLWTSDRWNVRERLLGTLVWPLGYPMLMFLFTMPTQMCSSSGNGTETCTGYALSPVLAVPVLVVALSAPVLVAAFLLFRAHGRPSGLVRD